MTNEEQREMLELAAKACGIDLSGMPYHDDCGIGGWNPIGDDGCCARMEAQLSICVWWEDAHDYVSASSEGWRNNRAEEKPENHNNDRNAARRMASTRVAAEIGRRMK